MRFMIMVRGNRDSEGGARPSAKLVSEMADYHEELAKAGVLADAGGLQSSAKGWRIRYSGSKRTVVDGPYAEAKELIAGFTIIDVKTREEALEWTRRFPNPFPDGAESEIEVRPFKSLDDVGDSEGVKRFRDLKLPSQK